MKSSRISGLVVSLIVMLILGASTTAVQAEIIAYDGIIAITSTDFPGEIDVGDIFYVSLTYDDSTVDTNGSTYGGTFNLAVQTYELTADPGNTGTWDPASGIFYINPVHNHVTNDNGDNMTIQMRGSGFMSLGGTNFLDAGASWSWDPSVHDLIDNGIGQTLRNIFGDVSPDFNQTLFTRFELRNGNYNFAEGTLIPQGFSTPTPTPCFNTGDCTLNGVITAEDAQMAFFIVLGLVTPTNEEFCAADCSGDGQVTAADAQQIFLTVLGTGSCADPL